MDQKILAGLHARQRLHEADMELVGRQQAASQAFVLERGWACAQRTLPSGIRQVLSVYVPGDLIGFRAVAQPPSVRHIPDRSVLTLTAAEVSEVDLDRLSDALIQSPGLARALDRDAARASAILEERLVSLGRRSARERTAHFYLELAARLSENDEALPLGFECPLSQYVVADVLGLSAEHLNRVMRQLRLSELLCVRRGRVDLLNIEGLVRLADFDPAYLRREHSQGH